MNYYTDNGYTETSSPGLYEKDGHLRLASDHRAGRCKKCNTLTSWKGERGAELRRAWCSCGTKLTQTCVSHLRKLPTITGARPVFGNGPTDLVAAEALGREVASSEHGRLWHVRFICDSSQTEKFAVGRLRAAKLGEGFANQSAFVAGWFSVAKTWRAS